MYRPIHPVVATLTCFAATLLSLARPAAAADPPARPAISAEQGQALVSLARQAMQRFLTHRLPPDKLPLSDAAKPLSSMDNAAAVTLRHSGPIVGVGICDEFHLPQNVAAAAQLAMRSPKLPDRVTNVVLDGLTVEVEVLSALRSVSEKDVHQLFRPGLTGLAYTQGERAARMLPSAAYVLDLDAEQVRRGALMSLRPSRATTQPQGLNLFTTRHFIQPPGAPAVELFRGKDLSRRQRIDQADLLAGAQTVGKFLVRNQLGSGRYATPDGDGSLREHARAAWAMAQLARAAAPGDPNSPFAASAAAAIDHAATFARRDAGAAMLADDKSGDRLAASAMLALAIRDLPRPLPKTWDLRVDLLNGLAKELLAADAAAASRPAVHPADLYTAYLALASVQQTDGQFARWLADIRKALAQIEANWPAEHALAFRSGLTAVPPWQSPKFRFTQFGADALPDETGAFALPDQQPSTVETGAAAVCLAKLVRASASAPADQARLAAQWLEARRFCWRMIYQPGEAYFSKDPGAWLGGVRAAPGSAHVTLGACSAAVEALLGQ